MIEVSGSRHQLVDGRMVSRSGACVIKKPMRSPPQRDMGRPVAIFAWTLAYVDNDLEPELVTGGYFLLGMK